MHLGDFDKAATTLGPLFWLVVSTRLKNISQIGSFPQVGVKIKKNETIT